MIGRSDELWTYVCSNDSTELTELSAKFCLELDCFAAIEDWMLPIVSLGCKTYSLLTTIRFYYPPDVKPPVVEIETASLTTKTVETIISNSSYADYISEAYIKERIQKGLSSGIYDGDKIVAWAVTHDDNAIGNLHVLPDYRHKGYAQAIVADLVSKLLSKGRMPVMNIEPDNNPSQALARNIGFMEDRNISWAKFARTR
jgi:8-oxo-dGTP diphosphatase